MDYSGGMLVGKQCKSMCKRSFGHESITITLEIYSHVLESMQDEAAE